jgi:hypothetical protein
MNGQSKWRIPRASSWLKTTVFITCLLIFAWVVVSASLQQQKDGGTFQEAVWVWSQNEAKSFPSDVEMLLAFLFQAGLLWFTFGSGNKRVTVDDKLYVAAGMVGSAYAWIVILFRHLSNS